MKLSVRAIIGFLLIVCISGCNLFKAKNPLCACWKLVSQEDGDKADSALNADFQYAYLRIYEDSSYTFVNPFRIAFGKWGANEKDSTLTVYGFKDSANLVLGVSALDGQWMRGKTVAPQPSPFLLKADPCFEYKGTDLLSRVSNQWRFKPGHKESKDEIRKRVIAHVEYMRLYFKMVFEEERPSFQSGFLHTPVKFYSNGIGLKTADDYPRAWFKAFYDEEDAKAGARLLGQSIESLNSYPKTKTFTEGYYIVLGQMKDYLIMLK